jgi:hypothetical protein
MQHTVSPCHINYILIELSSLRISDKRLACPRCDDVEKKYVKIVSIFRVEINDGEETLQISVPDNARRFSAICLSPRLILHLDPSTKGHETHHPSR